MKKTTTKFAILFGIMVFLSGCENQSKTPQDLPSMSPDSAGVSETKLLRIDTLVKQAIASRATPGAVVLVAKEGKVIYHKAFGKATLAEPMRKDTIFLMYSSSKIVPAIAIMKLVQQDRITLDDRVDKYLPEFKNPVIRVKSGRDNAANDRLVPAKKAITIRQLLAMTSGMISYWDTTYLEAGVDVGNGDPDYDLAENTRRLARIPLMFEPGTDYNYTMGIDVAGRVVEVVSGKNYAQFLQDEIFGPLGMTDTFFYPPPDKVAKMSVLWESDGSQINGKITPYKIKNRKLYSPGVGVFSTTGDYFKMGQMLLNHGVYNDVRILTPESVDEIRRNQIGNLDGVKRFHFFQQGYEKYGLGCFINGKGSFRDEGSISVLGLGGINFDLNFERNLLVVVQQSVIPPEPAWKVSEEISRLVYDALVHSPPGLAPTLARPEHMSDISMSGPVNFKRQ